MIKLQLQLDIVNICCKTFTILWLHSPQQVVIILNWLNLLILLFFNYAPFHSIRYILIIQHRLRLKGWIVGKLKTIRALIIITPLCVVLWYPNHFIKLNHDSP